MRDSNVLTEALVKSMEHEVYEAEKATQMQAQYVFSDAFEASMKKLIEHQRKGEISGDLQVYMPSSGASIDGQADDTEIPEYKTVIFMGRRIRLAAATAIIAALIFAMSIMAVAVIKPGIYYRIKELIEYLDIIPHQEEASDSETGFTPIIPAAPEGYSLTEETFGHESYSIEYHDSKGHYIHVYQFAPKGSRIYQDMGKEHRVEFINGHEIIITEHGTETVVITDNGESVIIISGSCGYEILCEMAIKLTEPSAGTSGGIEQSAKE